ncbi:MAG: hypothetical protein M0P42_07400, partial [Gallionella sp.]|nr:hypothetical protein [Gallionella sp.]
GEQSIGEQSIGEQSIGEQSIGEQSIGEQSIGEQEFERMEVEAQAGVSSDDVLPLLEEHTSQEDSLESQIVEGTDINETSAVEVLAEEDKSESVVVETDGSQSTEPAIEPQMDGQPQPEPEAPQESWLDTQPPQLTSEQMPRQDAPAFFSKAKIIGLTVAAASVIGITLWALKTNEPVIQPPPKAAKPAVSAVDNGKAAEEARPESSAAPTLNGLKLSDSLDQKQ